MTLVTSPEQFNTDDLYIDLRPILGHRLMLKCEGFNFAGSVKLKAAVSMITAAERSGQLAADSILVESSSGNLGIALSMIAASRDRPFVCVTDSRCNPAARRIMEAYGARVDVIDTADHPGGLLGARIAHVRRLCDRDPRYVWLNQYLNPDNWRAHYLSTGPDILRAFPLLDVLFVGAGTTGTLMGSARYLRRHRPQTKIIAVDAKGSVTFGGPPAPRLIPGLGASVRPQLLDETLVDDVVVVDERDTIRTCHRLAGRGFLFGGSTGTVVSGALSWLRRHDAGDLTAVAIAPDLGDRYLDTIYQPAWVEEHFGGQRSQPPSLSGRDPGWLSSTIPL